MAIANTMTVSGQALLIEVLANNLRLFAITGWDQKYSASMIHGIHDLHKERRLGYKRSWNLDHQRNCTETIKGHWWAGALLDRCKVAEVMTDRSRQLWRHAAAKRKRPARWDLAGRGAYVCGDQNRFGVRWRNYLLRGGKSFLSFALRVWSILKATSGLPKMVMLETSLPLVPAHE